MIRRRMLFLVVNGDVEQAALNPEEDQDAKDKDGDNVISTNPRVWFLWKSIQQLIINPSAYLEALQNGNSF